LTQGFDKRRPHDQCHFKPFGVLGEVITQLADSVVTNGNVYDGVPSRPAAQAPALMRRRLRSRQPCRGPAAALRAEGQLAHPLPADHGGTAGTGADHGDRESGGEVLAV
jgi:hypothetical protein